MVDETILPSARHSARALLAHLDFGRGLRPRPSQGHLLKPAHWLSEQALRRGGWSYREFDGKDSELDPLTVSYALAARTKFAASNASSLDLASLEAIAESTVAGYDRLMDGLADGYWTFEHAVAESQCVDTLEVIRMTAYAASRDILRKARPTSAKHLALCVEKIAEDIRLGAHRIKLPTLAAILGYSKQ